MPGVYSNISILLILRWYLNVTVAEDDEASISCSMLSSTVCMNVSRVGHAPYVALDVVCTSTHVRTNIVTPLTGGGVLRVILNENDNFEIP